MSVFQIGVLIWLIVLTAFCAFTFWIATRWVTLHSELEDKVKVLQQDKIGNVFAEEGLRIVKDSKQKRGSQDG